MTTDSLEYNEIDRINACCYIKVSYLCSKCCVEVKSTDVDDTTGYTLAEALHDLGWRTVAGELLCDRCVANKPEVT